VFATFPHFPFFPATVASANPSANILPRKNVAGRRGNHEGSIYQRSADKRWLGVALVGYDQFGKPVRKSVTAKTRNEVVQKLKGLRQRIDEGQLTFDSSIRVSELFERWCEDVLRHQVAPSAMSNYRSVMIHHVLPTLGHKRVTDLTVTDVDRLISEKTDLGLSTSTVRRIRAVLSQCLDQGIRWGAVNRNVARLSRTPKALRSEGRTLTPEQAKHLINSLKGHRHEALYGLMLVTGIRRGEALGLKWTDLDVTSGVLRIRRQLKREEGALVTSDTKTSRSRRSINLPAPMVAGLLAHSERQRAEQRAAGPSWTDSGFMFTSLVGTPIEPRNLHREFKQVCERAELGNWHLHELRHSAASLMLAQGIKIQVVSQVLGHASIRMTADVYGHILDPDREEAAEVMRAVLWD
jgi:integrase